MKLPADVQDVRRRFTEKFPYPPLTAIPGPAKEEAFRQWCIKLAQQIRFAFGERWGMKRASPARPISKDTLTERRTDGLMVWDLFGGVGTDSTKVNADPTGFLLTDQVFVPVAAINHLGGDVPVPEPPPPDPPPPPPPPVDPDFEKKILDALADVGRAQQATLGAIVGVVEALHVLTRTVQKERPLTIGAKFLGTLKGTLLPPEP